MILRPYQIKTNQRTNQLLNTGRHPLIVKPTGTGKTITGTYLIKDRISLGKRLIVLVPQLEILEQWLTSCTKAGLKPGYINDEGVVGRNRDVYICMYQSLVGLLPSLPEKFCKSIKEIITDEAHHSAAASYVQIYDHFSHCLRIGLTATPYREDNHPLAPYYTDIIEPIKMSEAIEKGYLCKPIIIIPDQYKNVVPEIGGEINREKQREYVKDKKIIGDMVKVYRDVFDGLPVIVPCTTSEHAREVTAMYKSAGWIVEHIHSKLTKYERRGIVRRVREGKINILVTVGVGVEGMDIPGLYGIIWMRFTESLTVYMQFNGRPMRPAPGKNHFIMIDPVGNSVLHGRPDIDRKWSLETDYVPGQDNSDDVKMRLCPVCGVMNASVNIKCHICNYDFDTGLLNGEKIEGKKRKLPKMIDGELVYLDGNDGLINKDINILTEGRNGNRNARNDSDNSCNFGIHSGQGQGDKGYTEKQELTKIEKLNILSKDLTGLKIKSKFREGVKGWL